jgi:hypothetical protein
MLARTEVDVPPVDYLMDSPLFKFIHFAANYCGYGGSRHEFIASWVHSLSLKANTKAGKNDNPSWKSTMNGPFREEYLTAACKGIETLEEIDAWEVVDRTDDVNVVDTIWAFRLK